MVISSQKTDVRVCVGIVTKNRDRYLSNCIDSIFLQSRLPDQIIVFNDASTDNTEAITKQKFEEGSRRNIKFNYLHSKKTKAQGFGRNRILEKCYCDIIVFVDDDVLCLKSWLSNLLMAYNNSSIGSVGGPALRVNKELQTVWEINHTVNNLNTINKYGELRDFSDNWIPSIPVETHVLRGANMSFRRDILERVGGFDESYFGRAWLEDVDPQVSIRKLGYKIIYDPNIIVLHRAIRTGGANPPNQKDDWYSIGYSSGYFVNKFFRKYRQTTLFRMLFRLRYAPLPLPRLIHESIRLKRITPLWAFIGFLNGSEIIKCL